MPIYEYECETNKHRFEQWQSIQDEPINVCPTCGSTVHRIMHAAGIIFKGSGWYITDSRKPTEKSKSDSDTKSEAPSRTESAGKSESTGKTETKSEKVGGESKASGSSTTSDVKEK